MIIVSILFLSVCSPVFSGWSEPVLLEQLNNAQTGKNAYTPHLSSDGLTLYFSRKNSSNTTQLVEAYRTTTDGTFGSERILSEFPDNKHVTAPWVSQDGLRLYYTRYTGSTWNYMIHMAFRDSVDDHWTRVSSQISGLEMWDIHYQDKNDATPTLTSDELTMFYRSARSGTYAIWMATRSSIVDTNDNFVEFTNPVMIPELSDIGQTAEPCILPDGLTIYFTAIKDGASVYDIYRATRDSLDQTFTNIEKVLIPGQSNNITFYVTPDESEIYFSAGWSDTTGIWYTSLEKTAVSMDIKPGSCPNPLNIKSKGVISVAVLGSEILDVTQIDPTSIHLAGVQALRSAYEDVAAPLANPENCNCSTEAPDGLIDLTLKFKTGEITEAIGPVTDGDILTLYLEGLTYDGIPIEGSDCIIVIGKFKPTTTNKAGFNKGR